jgi:hypothetical protein
MKYVFKRIEVKAIQFDGNNKEEIAEFTKGIVSLLFPDDAIIVKGDWIVKKENKYYIYSQEQFERTFDRVD